MTDIQRLKERIALLSVASNGTLVVIKLVVGLMIGSVSIISEAIHSGVDLLASFIALFSVKNSSIPADRGHPFGHGKIENISGTIEALLIFVAAGWIIYEAVGKIMHPEPITALSWGVIVMLISATANMVVSTMLFKVGRETDSIALQADAWHLRTDVYTSAGVMASLALILLAQQVWPDIDFTWMDPAAAIGVALLIIKAAYDLTLQSTKDLLDVALPVKEIEWVKQLIHSKRPLIHGYHHLHTRKSGHYRFVEFHIKVDPQMSVLCSHDITEELSNSIQERYPGTRTTIHVEPCDGQCDGYCLEGCLLSDEQRQEIKRGVYR